MKTTIKVQHPRTASDKALRALLDKFTTAILNSPECKLHLSEEMERDLREGLITGSEILPLLFDKMLIPFGDSETVEVEVDFSPPGDNPFRTIPPVQ